MLSQRDCREVGYANNSKDIGQMLAVLLLQSTKDFVGCKRKAIFRIEADQFRSSPEHRAEKFNVEAVDCPALAVKHAVVCISISLPNVLQLKVNLLPHLGTV